MKKAIIIILITLVATTIRAQRFGVKAGFNYASFYGDDSKLSSSIPGYHIGGVVEFPVNYDFSIQTELLLSQKGAKYSGVTSAYGTIPDINDGIRDYDYSDKPLYVEIPINAVFIFDSWTGRFNLAVGPYLAYGISGKRKLHYTINGKEVFKTFELFKTEINEVNPYYKRFDFGIGASFGYEFANKVFVNLGSTLGLPNIYNKEHQNLKNFDLTLSVGYKFRQP